MDEQFLKEIKKNLNEQDNRATSNPIFIVYDWERIPSDPDYTDDFMFVGDEGKIADTREKLFEWLRDNGTDESIVVEAEGMVNDYANYFEKEDKKDYYKTHNPKVDYYFVGCNKYNRKQFLKDCEIKE